MVPPLPPTTLLPDVLVTPRYLAGNTTVFDHGFVPLLTERSWPHLRDPDTGDLFITSPCQRLRVAVYPDGYDTWQITASPDPFQHIAWNAILTSETPPEIVAALTRALAVRLEHLPDSLFHEPPLTPVSVAFDPLVAAGWHKERTENFHRAESPDGLAGLQLQRWPRDEAPEPEPTDLIWQFTAGNGAAAWSAEFSRDTPLRILKALTVAVTDPAAVRREPALIPAAHRPHVTVHPITAASTGPAALAPAPDVRRPASR